jgi:hypothetical protein
MDVVKVHCMLDSQVVIFKLFILDSQVVYFLPSLAARLGK